MPNIINKTVEINFEFMYAPNVAEHYEIKRDLVISHIIFKYSKKFA